MDEREARERAERMDQLADNIGLNGAPVHEHCYCRPSQPSVCCRCWQEAGQRQLSR